MKFKNISEQDLSVPGVGIVKAGEVADLPNDFHNANFKRVAATTDVPNKAPENKETNQAEPENKEK